MLSGIFGETAKVLLLRMDCSSVGCGRIFERDVLINDSYIGIGKYLRVRMEITLKLACSHEVRPWLMASGRANVRTTRH